MERCIAKFYSNYLILEKVLVIGHPTFLKEFQKRFDQTEVKNCSKAVFVLHDQLNLATWPEWLKKEQPLPELCWTGEINMQRKSESLRPVLTNVLGKSTYADGGVLASKP